MLSARHRYNTAHVFSAHQTSQRYEMDLKHLGARSMLKPQGCDVNKVTVLFSNRSMTCCQSHEENMQRKGAYGSEAKLSSAERKWEG